MARIAIAPAPLTVGTLAPASTSLSASTSTGESGGGILARPRPSKEWIVPPRPKPGRKPAETEPPSKRKAQNRASQRAFRERRQEYVSELETKLKSYEHADGEKSIYYQQAAKRMKEENDRLRTDNEAMMKETVRLKTEIERLNALLAESKIEASASGTAQAGESQIRGRGAKRKASMAIPDSDSLGGAAGKVPIASTASKRPRVTRGRMSNTPVDQQRHSPFDLHSHGSAPHTSYSGSVPIAASPDDSRPLPLRRTSQYLTQPQPSTSRHPQPLSDPRLPSASVSTFFPGENLLPSSTASSSETTKHPFAADPSGPSTRPPDGCDFCTAESCFCRDMGLPPATLPRAEHFVDLTGDSALLSPGFETRIKIEEDVFTSVDGYSTLSAQTTAGSAQVQAPQSASAFALTTVAAAALSASHANDGRAVSLKLKRSTSMKDGKKQPVWQVVQGPVTPPPSVEQKKLPECSGDPKNCPACADDPFGKAFCDALSTSVCTSRPCASCPNVAISGPSPVSSDFSQFSSATSVGSILANLPCCGNPSLCGSNTCTPTPSTLAKAQPLPSAPVMPVTGAIAPSRLSLSNEGEGGSSVRCSDAWRQLKEHPNIAYANLQMLADVVARKTVCDGPQPDGCCGGQGGKKGCCMDSTAAAPFVTSRQEMEHARSVGQGLASPPTLNSVDADLRPTMLVPHSQLVAAVPPSQRRRLFVEREAVQEALSILDRSVGRSGV